MSTSESPIGKPGELKEEFYDEACRLTGMTDPFTDDNGNAKAYRPGSDEPESLTRAYNQYVQRTHGSKGWDSDYDPEQ
ncbi:hypothetical protein NIES2135_20830 [Leptolyngbya boryana NIES-2135]|uniref:Uncharacterized protein n=1 Tax=Leptolyngbya boryana NIES-2135 TaxID=1973484 RepID=A0A1Z4JEW9_LEPBY|nr:MULTISPECIES: hypothetical protein [Leptolyngbya]BAY55260.1 hypothetical protein NIES2135_20830 [Leptolyngbya boryana NIES-2135]MBD2369344.1 hypothetical protein [Leptolyngbya sp. FACHB-161]MBD2375654.1 hypothetical protein [Leptolyngbya sp. FACHB-238]MBD2401673.1 hypothetical protein [Leptolyngbya sp. FACHB-239]MBD2406588.1 hypothetical protein [Leptolyngbya sp. FACHB-402]